MFTHVKPTVRHIAPENLNGRLLVKVVYVVLEPQYQSALSLGDSVHQRQQLPGGHRSQRLSD